jgi:cation diffusion facilitator CzcD-associated flavoprotein CzcO
MRKVDNPMSESAVEVAIVGAGPYGLSLAAHLRALGVSYRIFGKPMQSWHEMPPGMFLKSEGPATNLSDPEHKCTLSRYCELQGIDPTGLISMDDFVHYGLWFQQQYVPDVEDTYVVSVAQTAEGFQLELENGEVVRARRVIMAVGINHFADMPPQLAALPEELASHTAKHRDLAHFSGQDVTIIGAGQSALQTAALLHEQGAKVRVLARKTWIEWNATPTNAPRSLYSRFRYPPTGLGPGRRNWVFQHLPSAFQFPIMLGCTIREAVPERRGVHVRFNEQQQGDGEFVTDHIIAGTGFRVDVDRLTFLSAGLRAQLRRIAGAPTLSLFFESSVPGLYFVGLTAANSFGPMLRFVLGTDFTARRISSHVTWKMRLSASRHFFIVAAERSPVPQDADPSVSQVP